MLNRLDLRSSPQPQMVGATIDSILQLGTEAPFPVPRLKSPAQGQPAGHGAGVRTQAAWRQPSASASWLLPAPLPHGSPWELTLSQGRDLAAAPLPPSGFSAEPGPTCLAPGFKVNPWQTTLAWIESQAPGHSTSPFAFW